MTEQNRHRIEPLKPVSSKIIGRVPKADEGLGAYEVALKKGKTSDAFFQADSALLKELGERLVGRSYIALAELVKNAYDADATRCHINIDANRIVVSDDGHGMTEREFTDNWMTIGTRNKATTGISRYFGRAVTGSKGVGRLAAQFLAHRMQLLTTSRETVQKRLHAFVDWDDATEAGLLTKATAKWREEPNDSKIYPGGSSFGTVVVMERLKQLWDEEEIRELGRQIWMLNDPLPTFGRRKRSGGENSFSITLETSLPGIDDVFSRQMRQAIENNQAVIDGQIVRRKSSTVSHVTVTFRDGETSSYEFESRAFLSEASWQIRVYDLSGKQAGGVSVYDMREYFEKYGGVMVYDAGFRLPYYGAENDWLGLEFDHSHRRSRSELLPENLQVSRALNDLPTQGRIFGIVNVDTGAESRAATGRRRDTGEYLKIQVSRDRLVGNKAFDTLRTAVRQSLDFYATLKRQRTIGEIDFQRPGEAATSKLSRVRPLLKELRQRFPKDDLVASLDEEFEDLEISLQNESINEEAARTLLGPLASTGMIALAMEHETRKEISSARSAVRRLKKLSRNTADPELGDIAGRLDGWLSRIEQTRKILLPMLDAEDRQSVSPLLAGAVVRSAVDNLRPFLGNVGVTLHLDQRVSFPAATITEWFSVLQNVLLNSVNATLDESQPAIEIRLFRRGQRAVLQISDNGVGVDLEDADELFRPFVRHSAISDERRELGLGGTGLGLTIVDMILSQRGAEAAFVEPAGRWATTLEITWRIGSDV